jgi:nucleoside-diphosphate-sugar epimerase
MLAQAIRRRAAGLGWETVLVGRGPDADVAFDLRAPTPIQAALEGARALVICSAAFGDDSLAGARENLEVNVLGSLALLEQAAGAGVGQVVYVSSTSAVQPRDSYGLSKATAEQLLAHVAPPAGVKLAVVRPSQIYDDAGDAAGRQPFLYFLIGRLADGQDVSLFGTKDVLRNYVHADDVADAILGCVREDLQGTFNATHPQSLKVSEVAEAVRRAFGGPGRIAFDASRPDMAEIAIPTEANLFARLGLSPRPFEAGLAGVRAARREPA